MQQKWFVDIFPFNYYTLLELILKTRFVLCNSIEIINKLLNHTMIIVQRILFVVK